MEKEKDKNQPNKKNSSTVENDSFYSELDPEEKKEIKREFFKFQDEAVRITNQCNTIIYSWIFVLNTGGLIGVITFLAARPKEIDYVVCCLVMMFIFLLGIILIYWTVQLERERFKHIINKKKYAYCNFKNDLIKKSLYMDSNESSNPLVKKIKDYEGLSFKLFLVGILIGILFSIFNPENLCDSKEGEKKGSLWIPGTC